MPDNNKSIFDHTICPGGLPFLFAVAPLVVAPLVDFAALLDFFLIMLLAVLDAFITFLVTFIAFVCFLAG